MENNIVSPIVELLETPDWKRFASNQKHLNLNLFSVQNASRALSFAHHGEILQGIFEDNDGCYHNGLITMPCPLFHSTAKFIPRHVPKITCNVPSKWKAIKAAELLFEKLALEAAPYQGGELILESDIPVSWGLGSSTCDVITSIDAVSRSLGFNLERTQVAKLAVEAEIASDSTMFTHEVVLFAQREGIILNKYHGSLPPLSVLGFNSCPELSGIDTLAMKKIHYDQREKRIFSQLLEIFESAIDTQDPSLLAKVSTESAIINQQHIPKPLFNTILDLVGIVNALGIQISHSGTVVGILFDGMHPKCSEKIINMKDLLSKLGIRETHYFEIVNKTKYPISREAL